LLAAATPALGAGAFGVHAGDDVPSLPSCQLADGSKTFHRCKTLPEPDPRFISYTVIATERSGVCSVSAVTADIATDPSGAALRRKVDELADAITAQFGGQVKKFDQIKPYTEIPPSDSWMGTMAGGQRDYIYIWTDQSDPATRGFRDRIVEISLRTKASSNAVGHAVLTIKFDNNARCSQRGE
jgi:hypothetical protein